MSELSRRSFLALAGGTVLLATCGGDDESGRSSATTATTAGGMDMHHTPGEFTDTAPGIVSSDLYASPEPQRFAFTVLAKEGYAAGNPARVAIAAPGKTPAEFVGATARAEGLPEFRGVYTIDAKLPVAGDWQGVLDYDGQRTPFAFEVHDRPQAPAPGTRAPTVASPTTASTLGVDPICTREPPCPLHTTSLDTLVGKGRPVAVMFATPARCQTAYCGPVLDVLLPLAGRYSDRIDFVHVEIYRDSRSDTLVPTVEDWSLESEPWLFGLDPAGRVVARLDGAFDGTEMRALLDGLVAS